MSDSSVPVDSFTRMEYLGEIFKDIQVLEVLKDVIFFLPGLVRLANGCTTKHIQGWTIILVAGWGGAGGRWASSNILEHEYFLLTLRLCMFLSWWAIT